MPELPEVEIASRQLRAWARGRRIESARADKSRVIRGQGPGRFASLEGHRLEDVERHGKWMLLRFDGGEGLISHLGMTGKWIRRRASEPRVPHARATLELDDGHALDYRDPRLFGRLVRGPVEKLRALPALAALGPEPLPEVDAERLHRVLSATRRSLKEALMDQRTLAGLGNIQVSESLHRAGLHPERGADSLAEPEARALARAIVDSLRATLDREDSPQPITYVEEGGENVFLVYDRKGEPCSTCGTEIERIVQGGRSTFYCPNCQPRAPLPRKRAQRAAARPAPRRAASRAKASRSAGAAPRRRATRR